ncbi:MAG TPA: glycoside hydrolase family 38 C-terminal domain-containing protein [Verrucomicrobiae bacterium]|jgi:alpha-mannosidase|nr:glycoside hydrolase family 38 C-terminal domain-containing protein [Verrucomicrobiae bacterium]
MLRLSKHLCLLMICLAVPACPQNQKRQSPAKAKVASSASDLMKQPTLYVVGYAHLDTEWRWEYPQVIQEYLSKTMRSNFALFQRYPHYIFNFSGANRYRLMKEYYPADYQQLKQYVAAGRWFPAGSSIEESDVNSPSAESIFRQVLYGNEYFRHDFGKASAEYMLPDCFGFPASLPSILAHSGIKGFSTQKLTWGSSAPAGGPDSPERTPVGTPFNVGIWDGPDGRSVVAAFNPGSYSADITTDLSKPLPALPDSSTGPQDQQQRDFRRYQGDWAARVQRNGQVSGLFTEYHYYGTGDIGGAPRESSVKLLEAIINKKPATLPAARFSQQQQPPAGLVGPVPVGDGPVHVVSAAADQMFLDIKPGQTARLPHYKGELELTNHSAGSLSSEAYQKRWNRKNELLADAAEKSSVMAEWLGGRPYPLQRLNDAWMLVLGGQFHDIMAGTATAQSYNYAWNDDVIALNQFAGVLKSATAAVASGLDTQAQGTPIVVYNPLNIAREDVVEAAVYLPNAAGGARVSGPDGKEVPAQVAGNKVLFLARAPSVGYTVYDIQPTTSAASISELKVSESSLENSRYKITVDQNGDVSSIFDKSISKELLAAPLRLALQTERPHDWPAWNMDWEDQKKPPRGYVQGPAKVHIVENGPVRVALQIERETEDSKFVQTIRLSAGDAGNRVEFLNAVDWKTREDALKAVFPLTTTNPQATYNWDVGTIQRGNNDEKKFEVASHQWFDLTDKGGDFGVTVLSDCKYGSDKPDDNTLRLTLIYTPGLGTGNGRAYSDQLTQDWGHHEFIYGLAGHAGDWRQAQTDWQAYRLNQPLIAFASTKHEGALGKELSLLKVSNSRVRLLALKRAEQGDEIIVRLVEVDGRAAPDVHLTFAAPVVSAREVNGQEMSVGAARTAKGGLVASFTPYQLHTFALKLGPAAKKVPAPQSHPLTLTYDTSVASFEDKPSGGCFDCLLDEPTAPQGKALPAEMLPTAIEYAGIRFHLAAAGKPNAVSAQGQTITLPVGKFARLYLLAAAIGDQKGTFILGGRPVELTIQDWTGKIGQWDTRSWSTRQEPIPLRPGAPAPPPGAPPRMRTIMDFSGKITPGFIKRDDVAWFASHVHGPDGNFEAYTYSYLFAYPIDLPANARTLTLPDNPRIRILAITATNEAGEVRPVQPLYDTLNQAQ